MTEELSIQDLLTTIKVEGVQLRTKERNSPKAQQKRRREARRSREVRRERVREAWRLEELRRNSTLYGQWKLLRRAYRKRLKDTGRDTYRFELSYDEWFDLWMECPAIEDKGGGKVPAWKKRGKNILTDVRMIRIDDSDCFRLGNLIVVYRGAILADGRKIAKRRELSAQAAV